MKFHRTKQDPAEKGVRWRKNCIYLSYIDLPRLALLSTLCGSPLHVSTTERFTNLLSLEDELIRLMVQVNSLLDAMPVTVISLEAVAEFSNRFEGTYLGFECSFRTKNSLMLDSRDSQIPIGDLDRDPQIYRKHGRWKVILSLDPKWITSWHAYNDFRAGHGMFSGLCAVETVRTADLLVRATPIVIGAPKGPHYDLFDGLAGADQR